jgi:hypothetical protein
MMSSSPRLPRLRSRSAGGLGVGLAMALVTMMILPCSCQDATQISLEVTTNVVWREGLVTTFTVGGDTQSTEGSAITTESITPWNERDRFVGSLTVVPRESDTSVVSVKVVMGFAGDGDAKKCVPPLYQGCIVARRRLVFTPHARLRLPIRMYSQCVDVPCDALSTCNELRQCVATDVTCMGGSCSDPGAAPDPSAVDAGPNDSSLPVDGAGADQDAASAPASNDSGQGNDGGGNGGLNAVECGSTTCPTPGFYCCFFPPQPNSSTCMVASTEQQCVQQLGGIALRCDGPGDCFEPMNHCCTSANTSACAQTCGIVQELCNDTPMGCEGAKRCTGDFNGLYGACE